MSLHPPLPYASLRAHVPARLAARISTVDRMTVPDERWTRGIALFADVTGFSALSETLAREAGGPERITQVLNQCLGTLTDTITKWGGDVVSFAGDAILAVWASETPEGALAAALGCVQSVRRQLDGFEPVGGAPLRLRFGLGAGAIWEPIVGDAEARCFHLAAGEAVRQATEAQAIAEAGEIVLSDSAAAHTSDTLTPVAVGFLRHDRSLTSPELPKPTPPLLRPDTARMARFVSDTVIEAIQADHVAWLAELRHLTIGFVHLEGFDLPNGENLADLQKAAATAAQVVERYSGALPSLLFDDKGLSILMVWGIAGHAHHDGATRALLAALEIHELIPHTRIGLATGEAFVGALGSEIRREYTVVGNAVNRASRVMESAEDEILCDGPTRLAARDAFNFSSRGLTPMRGFKDPVALFRPLGSRVSGTDSQTPMVSRDLERRRVLELVRSVIDGGTERRAVAITGEEGIGKSRFVASVRSTLPAGRIRPLTAAGSRFDRAAPYHAWKHLFRDLLDLDPSMGAEQSAQVITEKVDAEHLPLVALATAALGLDDAADGFGAGHSESTREVLAHLLARVVGNDPILLILDDAHWMDSASLALAEAVFHRLPQVVLLAVRREERPLDWPLEWSAFVERSFVEAITLRRLDQEDSIALACQLLDVDFLPAPVARLIREKAEGHPLFTEELVRSLTERDLVRVTAEDRLLDYDRRALAEFSPPDTLQGMVASRLDRLTVEDILTLKVASVLGREFETEDLMAIHPMQPSAGQLQSALRRMEDHDLVEPLGVGYQFRHAVFADVTYSLIPLTQRHQLHGTAASHFESTHAGDDRIFPLAQHWRLANVPERAVAALEAAGDRSAELGSFPESADFFADAYTLGGAHLGSVDRARLKRKQGVALRSMGDLTGSHDCLLRGLEELGRPMPVGVARIVGIVWAAMIQIMHRVWLRPFRVAADSPNAPRLLELAELYFALGTTTFQALDGTGLFYVGISGLNQAERVPSSGVLALSQSFLMYVTGVLGLRKIAGRYRMRARTVAERVGDPRVQAEILYNSAGLRGTLGEWDQAEMESREALALYTDAGDQKGRRTVQTVRAYHSHLRGDPAEERERYEELLSLGQAYDDATARMFAVLQIAEIELRAGHPATALDMIEALRDAEVEAAGGRGAILKLVGLRALAHLRMGTDQQAREHAGRFLDIIRESQPFTAPNAYDGHLLMARFFVEAPNAQNQLALSSREFTRFVRGLPVGRPGGAWAKGHLALLRGSRRRAERQWRKGLALAVSFRLPFEEMLLRRDLAGVLDGSERREHLTQALALAEAIGAAVERDRIKALLDEPSA